VCLREEGVPLRYPPLHGAPHPGLEASHALQAQADLLPLPEAIPDDVNVRHISILLDGDTPKINNITNSSTVPSVNSWVQNIRTSPYRLRKTDCRTENGDECKEGYRRWEIDGPGNREQGCLLWARKIP
ncbi:unnamed protein product, partial [Arctogadus glacialis]